MKKNIFLLILFTSTNIFSDGWTLQITIPGAGGGFNSVCAVSPTICWIVGPNTQIYRTTNSGTNWVDKHGNLSNVMAYSVYALSDQLCWIGAGDGIIYYTTNGGTYWILVFPSPSSPFIDVVHMFDVNNGFAIGDPAGSVWRYYITSDGGATYTLGTNAPMAGTSTEAGWNNSYWALDTGHIGWGSNNSRIYHGGWKGPITYTTITAAYQYGFALEDLNTQHGVALCLSSIPAQSPNQNTTNLGISWTASSYTPQSISYGIKCAPTIGAYEYWITGTNAFYYSSNSGATWATQYTVTSAGYCISMYNVQLGWAGGATGQIWRYIAYPWGIPNDQKQLPESFILSQNYPNPFNPTTTINFALPNANYVKLEVYDILGNEISVLVNDKMNAGNYQVEFDGSKLPSGVYFYKLVAGSFSEAKKMVITK